MSAEHSQVRSHAQIRITDEMPCHTTTKMLPSSITEAAPSHLAATSSFNLTSNLPPCFHLLRAFHHQTTLLYISHYVHHLPSTAANIVDNVIPSRCGGILPTHLKLPFLQHPFLAADLFDRAGSGVLPCLDTSPIPSSVWWRRDGPMLPFSPHSSPLRVKSKHALRWMRRWEG